MHNYGSECLRKVDLSRKVDFIHVICAMSSRKGTKLPMSYIIGNVAKSITSMRRNCYYFASVRLSTALSGIS